MSADAGNDADGGAEVPPEAVGQAAIEFMTGLATAFGNSATAELQVSNTGLPATAVPGVTPGPRGEIQIFMPMAYRDELAR